MPRLVALILLATFAPLCQAWESLIYGVLSPIVSLAVMTAVMLAIAILILMFVDLGRPSSPPRSLRDDSPRSPQASPQQLPAARESRRAQMTLPKFLFLFILLFTVGYMLMPGPVGRDWSQTWRRLVFSVDFLLLLPFVVAVELVVLAVMTRSRKQPKHPHQRAPAPIQTHAEATERVDTLLTALRSPISAEDAQNGWTEASRTAAIEYFSRLQSSLEDRSRLPPLGIVRGLDHWGVTGGHLLSDIGALTNDLRLWASKTSSA